VINADVEAGVETGFADAEGNAGVAELVATFADFEATEFSGRPSENLKAAAFASIRFSAKKQSIIWKT